MIPCSLPIKCFRRPLLLAALLLNPFVALAVYAAGPAAPPSVHDYREYRSSVDAKLRLFARFECRAPKGILVVSMHGWHGAVKKAHTDNIPDPLSKEYL
jgi:hypothetical protein